MLLIYKHGTSELTSASMLLKIFLQILSYGTYTKSNCGHSRSGIQLHHRQAPASYECCCSRRQRHAEVRPRTSQSTARRDALAVCSRAGAIQALCNCSPMSAAQGTTVHDGLLHQHVGHCSSAAPAVCCQLLVPRHRLSMFDCWAFSVAGPTPWNSLAYQTIFEI